MLKAPFGNEVTLTLNPYLDPYKERAKKHTHSSNKPLKSFFLELTLIRIQYMKIYRSTRNVKTEEFIFKIHQNQGPVHFITE